MTDAEKTALERRIDELCAEVEALKRDEWAAGFNAGCDAVEAAYEDGRPYYEVENAKLRELVRDMWPHVRHRSRMCAECELPCDESDECLLYEPMRDRMSELGIEVS